MPRLREVPRAEVHDFGKVIYQMLFGDRDPVAEPGTATGSPGNWWTVFAQSPDAFDHACGSFAFYRNPDRELSPVLRELAQMRVGWARGSRFVFSQHCKAARDNGVPEAQIEAVPGWASSGAFDDRERAVLAWVDALVLQGGRASDQTFADLAAHLSEVEILELTYITTLYDQHAVMTKALRLELDDVDDPITELTGDGISTGLGMG